MWPREIWTAAPTSEEIRQAAIASGAHTPIMRLPQGYETVLGRWFGGVDLSVGEWQRLALARAFLRQADLIVLDEPTSAMDSWAESRLAGAFPPPDRRPHRPHHQLTASLRPCKPILCTSWRPVGSSNQGLMRSWCNWVAVTACPGWNRCERGSEGKVFLAIYFVIRCSCGRIHPVINTCLTEAFFLNLSYLIRAAIKGVAAPYFSGKEIFVLYRHPVHF